LEARRAGGPFRSLYDLIERTDPRAVGKRALEALILAGACDSLAARLPSGVAHRAQLIAALDLLLREAQLRQAEAEAGQVSLFDAPAASEAAAPRPLPPLPDTDPWPEAERLAREKEVLGFFISGHPLEKYRDVIRVFEAVNTSTLRAHRDRRIELACVVTAVSRQVSRRGSEFWRITVEDLAGTATVIASAKAWEGVADVLVQDAAVLIRGTVAERDEDSPPIFLDDAVPLGELGAGGLLAVEVSLAPAPKAEEAITAAAGLLRANRGAAPLLVGWRGRCAWGPRRRPWRRSRPRPGCCARTAAAPPCWSAGGGRGRWRSAKAATTRSSSVPARWPSHPRLHCCPSSARCSARSACD